MKKENEEKFYNRFTFFKKENLFDFSCEDGWFDLLWKLCEDLEKLHFNEYPVQIKEKLGTLRFYVSAANNNQWKIIEKAEFDSETICEICGKKGKLRNNDWLKTLCNQCYKKWKNRKNRND